MASALLICWPFWLGSVQVATSQEPASRGTIGTIGGVVVDADAGEPLRGARVYLEPLRSTVVAEHSHNGIRSFRFSHVAETDSSGVYLFRDLPAGRYRVHVERAGYGRSEVEVELDSGDARLTLGLQLDPILLPHVLVKVDPTPPFLRTASPTAELYGARQVTVRRRQVEHLGTDTRTLTAGQVTEAITAGEPDLFRALQRMPGVGRRDDYTAILWTRGAPWVQTRVYFDGLPLYNPTHAGSLFSSISPNGVGEVTYQPGVRSAESGEGAAGVVDLRSRPGRRGQGVSGSADLSLVSAQLAVDGDLLDGGVTWMVAGRRTHVDVLAGAWDALRPDNGLQVPYDFADVTARVDVRLGPATLEASGLNERDRLRGDIPGLLIGNTGRWGNRLGQLTLRVPIGPVEVSAYTGATRFATIVDEKWRAPGIRSASDDEVSLPALESGIDHDRSGVRVGSAAHRGDRFQWALGYDEIEDRIRYDGPFSLLGEGIPGLVRDSLARVPFRLTGSRRYHAVWGEGRLRLLEGLEVQAGARVEEGDSIRNLGHRLLAPRFAARWSASPDLAFSAGWGRSFQYTQAIGAAAGPLGPQLHLGHLWVLAGPGYPAIQADIMTAGTELWLTPAWLVGANVYYRESTGITDPDPTPGPLRPDRGHVETDASARGLELSARRLLGRWTGSLGYALARAETVVGIPAGSGDDPGLEILRYPGSADVRHSIDATSSYRLADAWRLGAAFSSASGVPFTRVIIDETGESEPRIAEPGARRTPAYASLDLLLDYTGEVSGWRVNAYVQLLNALGRRNRVTYAGSFCAPTAVGTTGCGENPVIRDRFRSGLPRLPLVGVRVAF
jgi:hypothetical protein